MSKPTIAVVGAGLMGHGIAQIFAAADHAVFLYDTDADALASAPQRIGEIFDLLGEDPAGAANVTCLGDFEGAVANADFVFEAVMEDAELKQRIFARLDEVAPPRAVLATNTSAIPIGRIAADVSDKGRVVGTHFWNPPHLVALVEVVQAAHTAPEAVARVIDLLRSVGKFPVHCRRDIPGFIGNRLQHALKREAIALVAAGVCDAETVDAVVRNGFGARMAVLGPLEQSDLVGLDLTLAIQRILIADLDRTAEPQALLRRKVAAGELGMKTGRGFRDWTPQQAAEVRQRLSAYLADMARRQKTAE